MHLSHKLKKNFFYYSFGLHWVFIAAHGLSLVAENRGYSLVGMHRFLIAVTSLVAAHRL